MGVQNIKASRTTNELIIETLDTKSDMPLPKSSRKANQAAGGRISNQYIERLVSSCDERLTDLNETEKEQLANKLHFMAEISMQDNTVHRFSLEVTQRHDGWAIAFVAWLPQFNNAKILVEGSVDGQWAQKPKDAMRWLLDACQQWGNDFVTQMMEEGHSRTEAEEMLMYFE